MEKTSKKKDTFKRKNYFKNSLILNEKPNKKIL